MTQTDIFAEIEDLIEKEARPLKQDWIVQSVLDNHPGITGVDRHWYIDCASSFIQDCTLGFLRRFKPSADATPKQMRLEGFERLQRWYPVERNGERLIVPTTQLTEQEMIDKEDEYLRMAAGCEQHAREMRRLRKATYGQ